jgi:hypothetical protein
MDSIATTSNLHLIDRPRQYLRHYANRDLPAVSAMLADTVTLRDWKISVRGKEAAVRETSLNFSNSATIEIDVLSVQEGGNTVSAELRILVDGMTELFVVDVLAFDRLGQIEAIRSYIGRGD